MCIHAILRIKYLSDKSAQTLEVASEKDMREKLEDLKNKDQVTKISVFLCHHHVVLSKEWKEELYSPEVQDVALGSTGVKA